MVQSAKRWNWLGALTLGCMLIALEQGAIAQITPDASLGDERSAHSRGVITGGARRNANLLHSFSEFNVGDGEQIYFASPSGIERIISRVTGSKHSTILGTLGVLGSADLFLLNPNGIVFGPNAQLDLSGSFLASTADALLFNNFAFSTSNPQAPPLLTITTPTGLQMGQHPGTIVNRSQATSASGNTVGLQVERGQTLGLIGGPLKIEGGHVIAPQGRIELGSVGPNSLVRLDSTGTKISARYNDVQDFQNIDFSQQASINASGPGGGTIRVRGQDITLTQGASIYADTLGRIDGDGIDIQAGTLTLEQEASIAAATFGSGKGGDLTVRASESIDITGTGLGQYQQVYVFRAADGSLALRDRENGLFGGTQGFGQSGDIVIETEQLNIQDGGTVTVNLLGNETGGSISVAASDVNLRGGSISMAVLRGSTGNAGTITVETERLRLWEAGLISNSTVGQGNGGKIVVDASDSIFVQGFPENSLYSSGFATISIAGAEGQGGQIEIDTGQLTILDGGGISTNSGELTLREPLASLVFQSFSEDELDGGPANNIRIAAEKIEVDGTSTDEAFPSRIVSRSSGVATAGEISINTEELIIRDGAVVGVDSNQSNAGDLNIIADFVRLERGELSAETASGQEGGNINLAVQKLLKLESNSEISTTADGAGNGGNITIDTQFLIAVPGEDSNIVADASEGRGGDINITAQGIFGIASRDRSSNDFNDITASSELGVEGIIEITTSEIDPGEELGELPQDVVNVAQLIDQNVCSVGEGSEFAITGRGGMPDSPQGAFSPKNFWEDWRITDTPSVTYATSPKSVPAPQRTASHKLIEAQGWLRTDSGSIVLTAEPNLANPSSWLPAHNCQQMRGG
ncbi:MAG: filamentous hemagglutinin N-terminal domain-containing protein [Cyanophyceae cyanobacterium]